MGHNRWECKTKRAREWVRKLLGKGAFRFFDLTATVADYEALIRRVVQTPTAEVFLYRWEETAYPTVVAEVDGGSWLVMLGLDGVIETAFPPEDTADRVLAEQAHLFHQELQRFVDLATYRREQGIPPERWWWYLDVVRYVPRRAVVTPSGA